MSEVCHNACQNICKKGWAAIHIEGRGLRLSSNIAGRSMMLPDAVPPVDTRTLVPSSKYLYATRQGALQSQNPSKWSFFFPSISKKQILTGTSHTGKFEHLPIHRIDQLPIRDVHRSFHGYDTATVALCLLQMLFDLPDQKCEPHFFIPLKPLTFWIPKFTSHRAIEASVPDFSLQWGHGSGSESLSLQSP